MSLIINTRNDYASAQTHLKLQIPIVALFVRRT